MPAQAGKYYWSKPFATDGCDDSPEIRVCVPVGEGIKAKDCDVKIGKRKLRAGLRGQEPVIDDELWKDCEFEESSWELKEDGGQRCIVIAILKVGKWDVWPYLLRCEEVKVDTTITHRVFLDVAIGDDKARRIVVGLYGKVVPKAAENFRALCTGEKGLSKGGTPLHFRGCAFHRIVPDFICQAGDITTQDGTGSESIYGEPFEDECYDVKHNKVGLLSMANGEKDLNGSQFFITLKEAPQLDKKHVVFGEVLEGYGDVVQKIGKCGSKDGQPQKHIVIENCGELP